jgi:protein-S-isoprenylcysteine O-methyltransferase Ste14
MKQLLIFAYGIISYAIFLIAFLYSIAFVGSIFVPKTLDSGPAVPFSRALMIDAVLLSLFAIQHSVMARQGFKRRWTKVIPLPAERSTYVLLSSLVLLLMYWQWQPIQAVVWSVENAPVRAGISALFWAGWALVLLSTFAIDHFDLFGLRQVWMNFVGRPYVQPEFRMDGLHRYLRHPIMLGFIVAFWAAPVMTLGHLVFALTATAYVLVGIYLEELDLVRFYGETYRAYRSRVRALLPLP